jgi:hypothetical protein
LFGPYENVVDEGEVEDMIGNPLIWDRGVGLYSGER